MKLVQLPRDALLKPLQAVTGIVERRHTLPILSNVLIERHADSLRFVATDLELQIATSCAMDKKTGETLAVTVSARKLVDILRALPDGGDVALELSVATYEGIARTIDAPRAVRAVGTAVGHNPIAFVIPCHRVIRATGAFGEYRWGAVRKKAILVWEQARTGTDR